MTDTKLDIAFWDYDRTQALVDGTAHIDGVDATFHSGRIVTEIFEKMIRDRAYDVSELGMTYFLRTMEFDDPPLPGDTGVPCSFLPAFGDLRQHRQGHHPAAGPSGQDNRRTRHLRPRRRSHAQGHPVR